MMTWDADKALKKLSLIKNPDPGIDATIFDEFFFGVGDEAAPGFPFFADIVNAGWYTRALFDAVAPPTGGDFILAFSVTFIFTTPPDLNGDNYLDTALNEVYYNDNFAWSIGPAAFDVETVALHENGHSLGIGHFGPPPAAVMNPAYAGVRRSPFPPDHAGMAAVFGGWPK